MSDGYTSRIWLSVFKEQKEYCNVRLPSLKSNNCLKASLSGITGSSGVLMSCPLRMIPELIFISLWRWPNLFFMQWHQEHEPVIVRISALTSTISSALRDILRSGSSPSTCFDMPLLGFASSSLGKGIPFTPNTSSWVPTISRSYRQKRNTTKLKTSSFLTVLPLQRVTPPPNGWNRSWWSSDLFRINR